MPSFVPLIVCIIGSCWSGRHKYVLAIPRERAIFLSLADFLVQVTCNQHPRKRHVGCFELIVVQGIHQTADFLVGSLSTAGRSTQRTQNSRVIRMPTDYVVPHEPSGNKEKRERFLWIVIPAQELPSSKPASCI